MDVVKIIIKILRINQDYVNGYQNVVSFILKVPLCFLLMIVAQYHLHLVSSGNKN